MRRDRCCSWHGLPGLAAFAEQCAAAFSEHGWEGLLAGGFHVELSCAVPYLTRSLRNFEANWVRHHHRHRRTEVLFSELPEGGTGPTPEAVPPPQRPAEPACPDPLVRLELLAALQGLSPSSREVLNLHVDGYTSGQIAARRAIRSEAVRRRLSDARRKLRRSLMIAGR